MVRNNGYMHIKKKSVKILVTSMVDISVHITNTIYHKTIPNNYIL